MQNAGKIKNKKIKKKTIVARQCCPRPTVGPQSLADQPRRSNRLQIGCLPGLHRQGRPPGRAPCLVSKLLRAFHSAARATLCETDAGSQRSTHGLTSSENPSAIATQQLPQCRRATLRARAGTSTCESGGESFKKRSDCCIFEAASRSSSSKCRKN